MVCPAHLGHPGFGLRAGGVEDQHINRAEALSAEARLRKVEVRSSLLCSVPSPAGPADLSTSAVLRWCGQVPAGNDRDRAFLHRA
jgi:hypothetical protein